MTNPMVPAKYKHVCEGCVTIGEHVIIGSHNVILPSCHIKQGVAIGAMSLTNRNLDEWGHLCRDSVSKN